METVPTLAQIAQEAVQRGLLDLERAELPPRVGEALRAIVAA